MKLTLKKSFELTGIRTRISQLAVRYVSQSHSPAMPSQREFCVGLMQTGRSDGSPVYIVAQEMRAALMKPLSRG
jgi:hypothetical protein